MDWNKLQSAGNTRKKSKSGKFVSRSTGRDANGERPSTAGKVRGLAFSAKCKLEKTDEIPVNKDKEGNFYYQARIKGRFGKRMAISESLARKLA